MLKEIQTADSLFQLKMKLAVDLQPCLVRVNKLTGSQAQRGEHLGVL